jgi:hypothetical protein
VLGIGCGRGQCGRVASLSTGTFLLAASGLTQIAQLRRLSGRNIAWGVLREGATTLPLSALPQSCYSTRNDERDACRQPGSVVQSHYLKRVRQRFAGQACGQRRAKLYRRDRGRPGRSYHW